MPSSVILGIKYFNASNTLRIFFVSGMIYDYLKVPEKIYEAMKKARSKGIYFNLEIKGRYRFKKIDSKN